MPILILHSGHDIYCGYDMQYFMIVWWERQRIQTYNCWNILCCLISNLCTVLCKIYTLFWHWKAVVDVMALTKCIHIYLYPHIEMLKLIPGGKCCLLFDQKSNIIIKNFSKANIYLASYLKYICCGSERKVSNLLTNSLFYSKLMNNISHEFNMV